MTQGHTDVYQSAGERILLGGVTVDLFDRQAFLALVSDRLRGYGPRLLVASANLDHLDHFADTQHDVPTDTGGEWIVTLDGKPLVWAANVLTGRHWDQLAGSDLLPEILDIAETLHCRVGFLGGTRALHEILRRRLSAMYPRLSVSGYWAPSRDSLTNAAAMWRLADDVAAAGTDLLVVGLGKPRQEHWLARYATAAGVRVGLAFGASSEFLAGQQRRAPAVTRTLGFEWGHRLLCEPRRLWRRYLLRGPVALARLLSASQRL